MLTKYILIFHFIINVLIYFILGHKLTFLYSFTPLNQCISWLI